MDKEITTRTIFDVIRSFIGGTMPTEDFVQQLINRGVKIDADLGLIIRNHEAGNCVTFKDFAKCMRHLSSNSEDC
jgi:hypothetical protein